VKNLPDSAALWKSNPIIRCVLSRLWIESICFMKEFKNRLYKTSIVLVFLLISGCSGSLVADVTPPPGYQPTIYPQSTAYVQAEISPLLPRIPGW
jgi:hypothetical protein